ncbi:hypothetical protein [Burkholderia diffusa]|uniref:hypothetical protein n=1 Tax=Burkholderia diffusa TaxID=488732 RepID=UPI001E31069D|nr:hypothetical protein [Burkholderia diffusa]
MRIESNHLAVAEVRNKEPVAGRIKTCVVEPGRAARQRDVHDVLQRQGADRRFVARSASAMSQHARCREQGEECDEQGNAIAPVCRVFHDFLPRRPPPLPRDGGGTAYGPVVDLDLHVVARFRYLEDFLLFRIGTFQAGDSLNAGGIERRVLLRRRRVRSGTQDRAGSDRGEKSVENQHRWASIDMG